MTTTQTLSNHSSFATKLLNDSSIHNFASTKPLAENEAFAKSVSHRTTRNSSATKALLSANDQNDHLTRQEVNLQSRESIRKPEKNLHTTSSENSMHNRSDLLANKSIGKADQSLENTLMDKTMQGYEVARNGKTNEDDTGYNTRIHVKPSEYLAKADDSQDISSTKKSVSEAAASKQSRGYQLRSTGGKSSYRSTEFMEEEEDEHPARNLSSTDLSSTSLSNQKVKDQKVSPSSKNGRVGGSNDEIASSYGGNVKKSGSSKSNKQPSLHSMICTEEISTFDIPTDTTERDENRGQMPETALNCTEELEDFKEQLQVDSDSNDSSTRSGSIIKVDRQQRKKETKCFNKLCLTDHKVPSLWSKEKVNGSMICRVCLDAYKREQFCHFCDQIYLDDDSLTATDDKDWIECDSCGCWNHIQCEAAQGLKNIFSLLQKGRNYKYFCPPCRQGKNQKKVKATTTAQGSTSITLKPLSPGSPSTNVTVEKPESTKNAKNEHPRPPLDDWLACEEGLEEPTLVKVRVNDNRETKVGVSQNKEEEKDQEKVQEEEDPIKKKLDSIFTKANNKKRNAWKAITNVIESFSEADKLMTQYGGKKLQLSEQEIKSDLNQIRELCNIGQSSKDTESASKVTEAQTTETRGRMTVEESSESESVEEKPTSRTKNSRAKQQKRGEKVQERDRSSRAIKEERIMNINRKEKQRDQEKDFAKDFENSEIGTTARRNLRMRKVN